MKTILSIFALAFILTSCSSIPENPRMAFGKKCEVTPDSIKMRKINKKKRN